MKAFYTLNEEHFDPSADFLGDHSVHLAQYLQIAAAHSVRQRTRCKIVARPRLKTTPRVTELKSFGYLEQNRDPDDGTDEEIEQSKNVLYNINMHPVTYVACKSSSLPKHINPDT